MKTAIHEIIEKFTKTQRFIISNNQYAKGYDSALSDCITLLKSFLEKEKLQIIESYEYGNLQEDYTRFEDALNYYEETYKK